MNSKKMFLSLCMVIPFFFGCSQMVNKFDEKNFTPAKLQNLVHSTMSAVLNQRKPEKENLGQVKTNLENIKANIEQNQLVNFDNLRKLINVQDKYKFVVNAVLSLTEHYIKTYTSNFLEDNKRSVEFVLAGINGGLSALDNYLNN